MLGVTAATGFIDWAPTKYLPNTGLSQCSEISQWLDEQYMWMSVATLAGFVWILYLFAHAGRDAIPAGDAEPRRADDRHCGSRAAAGRPHTHKRRRR